jgi:hypothetical protein
MAQMSLFQQTGEKAVLKKIEGDDALAYEGDIDLRRIIAPPPDLSDLLSLYLDRKDKHDEA